MTARKRATKAKLDAVAAEAMALALDLPDLPPPCKTPDCTARAAWTGVTPCPNPGTHAVYVETRHGPQFIAHACPDHAARLAVTIGRDGKIACTYRFDDPKRPPA